MTEEELLDSLRAGESIWMILDSMWERYSSFTFYSYCGNKDGKSYLKGQIKIC